MRGIFAPKNFRILVAVLICVALPSIAPFKLAFLAVSLDNGGPQSTIVISLLVLSAPCYVCLVLWAARKNFHHIRASLALLFSISSAALAIAGLTISDDIDGSFYIALSEAVAQIVVIVVVTWFLPRRYRRPNGYEPVAPLKRTAKITSRTPNRALLMQDLNDGNDAYLTGRLAAIFRRHQQIEEAATAHSAGKSEVTRPQTTSLAEPRFHPTVRYWVGTHTSAWIRPSHAILFVTIILFVVDASIAIVGCSQFSRLGVSASAVLLLWILVLYALVGTRIGLNSVVLARPRVELGYLLAWQLALLAIFRIAAWAYIPVAVGSIEDWTDFCAPLGVAWFIVLFIFLGCSSTCFWFAYASLTRRNSMKDLR
ncbi:hypothetical protein QBC47DRAFT_367162 [Echria macrotheca]|uniref:Uncharacterized protein n=1 Tax=Echria macrotheca TaxID=438768 RepID=A0AAJ0BM34_9PEZI|nr:hypothetical protein QBC47DRAFT_367162 [Echria macrotheca]